MLLSFAAEPVSNIQIYVAHKRKLLSLLSIRTTIRDSHAAEIVYYGQHRSQSIAATALQPERKEVRAVQ